MDPLSALSIAATVVQFIQFGGSLVSKSHQIYTSSEGKLTSNVECETAATRLVALTEQLKNSLRNAPSGGISADEFAIEALCNDCIGVSKELLAQLKKLSVEEGQKRRKWKSFRQALKSVWSKEDIDKIAGRLGTFRQELDSHLIVSTRNKVNALAAHQTEAFSSLDQNTRNTIRSLIEEVRTARDDILQQTATNHKRILQSVEHREVKLLDSSLLQSLRFPSMSDRHIQISEAHKRTFKWIFERAPVDGPSWSSFKDWLAHGNGLYWVNGKAASGKSTLMRYILEHIETANQLRVWANGAEIEKAGFFFWNSGVIDQRSQLGLFQSLLYEILRRRPELVRHIFPDDWATNCVALAKGHLPSWSWSLTKLQNGFKKLTDFATSSLKLCFFIDGLDEYEGDHEGIAELFKDISSSPHVKVCVSSRPWIVFEDMFKDLPGLRLQDLTFPDIQAYVRAELEENSQMLKIAKNDPQHCTELVDEIVTKASGVFLWVKLVVRSLLTGLRNRDGVSILQKRLKDLPADLGDLYTHMLRQVDPLYQQEASQIFRIYEAIPQIDSLVPAILLQLAMTATPQRTLSIPFGVMTAEEYSSRCEEVDIHLKTRCAGLLEIYDSTVTTKSVALLHGSSINSSSKHAKSEKSWTVNYLHRSVGEFLKTEDVQARILQHAPINSEFEPNMRALMGYIVNLKTSDYSYLPSTSDPVVIANRAMHCAREVGDFEISTTVQLLDELDRVIQCCYEDFQRVNGKCSCLTGRCHWTTRHNSRISNWEWEWGTNFLAEAIRMDLCAYVRTKLSSSPSILPREEGAPYLVYALLPGSQPVEIGPHGLVSLGMVSLLLRHGANPNELWSGFTPWQQAMISIHSHLWSNYSQQTGCWLLDEVLLESWGQIFQELLRNGASPAATCKENHDLPRSSDPPMGHTVLDVISDVFDHYRPLDSAEIRQVLMEQLDLRKESTLGQPSISSDIVILDRKRHHESDAKKPRKRVRRKGLSTKVVLSSSQVRQPKNALTSRGSNPQSSV